MPLSHHASDETLFRRAAGTLPAGQAVVLDAHLALCAACRERVGLFECVGGALLDTTEPTLLAPAALADTLRAIDAERAPLRPGTSRSRAPIDLDGVPLPESLAGCGIGPWRWIGPGVKMSRVDVPDDDSTTVILLKVGAGRRMPEHGHTGTEFTYVVSGSFSDAMGRYGPGDLEEVDSEVEHQPVVDAGAPCICLAALEGTMRLNSFLGRLVQPLVGF